MNVEAIQFIDKIQHISDELRKYNKFLSEDRIALFQKNYLKLKNNLEGIMKSKRNLQIGIIGEVKAGKSSFINALIFDGKDILPKAPTPMTAALTKISYGDRFEAEIVFYDENDWNIIQHNAHLADRFLRELYEQEMEKSAYAMNFEQFCVFKKDDVPKEYSACKELIEMAEKNNLNVSQYIGQKIEINADEQDEYIEKLNHYVGAEGQFTPIVKYSVIKLNNERLKNIEIVDTPGMNDPIVSRTIVTSDFLMNCDVVFFLSYAGQFLSQEEMGLLTRSLPENSISHAYLIASKFDSAILDYKQKKAPLKTAVQHTLFNLNQQATTTIGESITQQNTPAVVKVIQANLPPHPTSGLMYSSAMKLYHNEPLTKAEEHILKQFEKRFEGFSRSPKELMKLANVHTIEGKILSKVKTEKDNIITERSSTIIQDQHIEFLRLIRQMEEQTIDNIQEMKHSDVSGLKNKVEKISSKLQSIRKNVNDIFTANYLKASRILVDIKIDVEKEINNHTGVKVAVSTSSDTGTRRTGFLGLKRESYTITTTNYTAEVTEVVASIRKYITRSREMINNEFKRLFDLQNMKKDVANEVVGAFELISNEFNESEIKRALEIVLNQIVIQDIEVDQSKYDAKITSTFSSPSVRNEEISNLQLEQERILQQVANDIKSEIDSKIKEIELLLEKYAANFIDDIEAQITVNAKKIEMLLKDKEANLKRMEEIALKLNVFKKQLAQ
ncbi:dynamin family protein [Lysinibacillus capsici]|uniref:dynamin family protein n=1 Tax=Lysinibacillus capsici TaxID=2115968 RepID=UPI0030813F19|nr:dynamin family protein [Lysinibacillus capsici]